ncbi:hypothetical protein [Geminicoccus harenae]|uniref:hypothetical protein n=1 Tax=Geminicoccus harenae TaxID=2498453 RepID=UPI00168B8834|nr:hypothetical protein [Geminicoccus harenae]
MTLMTLLPNLFPMSALHRWGGELCCGAFPGATAGVAFALEPDGRITWKSLRPIAPNVLAHLRGRCEEIRAALVAANAPAPANDAAEPTAEARAYGRYVEMRPAGLLIDTNGHPSDLALIDRLHHLAMDHDNQAPAWLAHLLADPGEVGLHGELDTIEQECSGR